MMLRASGRIAVLLLALAACRRETPGDPTGPAITATTLGRIYLQEGRLPEAEGQFREVIRLIPRAGSGYANLAQVFLRAERYRDAERELGRAITRDTGNVDYHLLLARAYARSGRVEEARQLLRRRADVGDPRLFFALASMSPSSDDSLAWLGRALAAAPANLAVRLALAETRMHRGEADSALAALEAMRQQWAEPPAEVLAAFAASIAALQANDTAAARAHLERFHHVFELTTPYQASMLSIAGVGGPVAGYPVLTLSPLQPGPDASRPEGMARFVDGSVQAGVPEHRAAGPLVTGDVTGDGVDELFLGARVYRVAAGRLIDITDTLGIRIDGQVTAAAIADENNDGNLDLFLVDARGPRLYRGNGQGRMRETAPRGLVADSGVGDAVFMDLDQDGDLDLVLSSGRGLRAWRNNLNGTYTEVAAAMGLAAAAPRRARFADLDGDGRIDLLVSSDSAPVRLFRNRGERRYVDAGQAAGLPADPVTALDLGDYDNDGLFDLALAPARGGGVVLYRNRGDGTFIRDDRAVPAFDGHVDALAFLDFDNDGRLDILAGGRMRLLHNDGDGRFSDRSALLPAVLASATAVLVTDYDGDGDEDIVVESEGRLSLLRNEGGNLNSYASIQLTALRTGSGKNNSFGIGARLELRAGPLLQARVVTGRQTHFGLGAQRGPDVLRIEWPNGVPQVLASGVSSEVREEEVLKGSCAFVYGWNGGGFELLTDVMWRSALGMPVGIMSSGATAAYAPPQASTEYILVRGEALVPRQDRLTLQFTEELWETAYLDQARLLAVDHPDSVQVLVNERFVPPGPTPLALYHAAAARPPVAARDGNGMDVLPLLLARDDRYVANLVPTRYQGVVESHALELDLGDLAGMSRVLLVLNGWIYPSDASINVAIAQSGTPSVEPPVLEVPDVAGRWRVVIPDLGFPAGKRKNVVADLTGKFPTRDHRVRIRTNMQIYWDQAFVASGIGAGTTTITTLAPTAAELHFRGFSRTYRRGGRYGPQWFDYDSVSAANPWRPITGRFTRYGDVLPLLDRADDRYVVMAPGDEATVHFDAGALPPLPAGWRRDYVLYTDGWIKDSDLNTATGASVDPLPFHAMRSYPYDEGEQYPSDASHRLFLEQYLTRVVR